MKKKNLLVGLLSMAFVATSALAIVACDNSGSTKDPTQIEQVYAQYVVYAQAEGIEPLSYEQWLATIKGEKGDKGDKGDTGATGETGKSAYEIWFELGNEGDEEDFLAWLKGEAGEKGDKGDQGEQGIQGEKGDKGDQGEQGIQGEKGDKGDTGEQGIQGEKGDQGEQGIQGEKGDKGDTGAQGIQGETGVGIEKVEYDENGDLKITFTDGTTQTVAMPDKHVHNFGDWTEFTGDEVLCENKIFFHTCTTCNAIEWKQGASADHDWDIVTTDPTCQAQGYDTKTCTICGKVEVENYTAIVEHPWNEEHSTDRIYHWIDCEVCDEIKDKQEHTVDDSGECSICGRVIIGTVGLIYSVSADGTYAEVIGYEGMSTKINFADTYEGLPVKSISARAFYDKNNVVSVTIPDTIESIGDYAFAYCTSLKSITIPNSVTSIGIYAFEECSSLTSVELGDSVTSIGAYAFIYCSNLTSIVIPYGVTTIGAYTFYNCASLTSVVMPDSVTTIGYYAFHGCSNLTSVYYTGDIASWCDISFICYTDGGWGEDMCTNPLMNGSNLYIDNELVTELRIPETVTEIKAYAFYNCDSLTSVIIPESVTSISNYAFTKCSNLASVVIGDNVEMIGYCAFKECSSLTSVVIPDSVTAIGADAFAYCRSLTSVVIGDSVTSIGDYAFNNCASLTSVTFKNTSGWGGYHVIGDSVRFSRNDLVDPAKAANLLKNYYDYNWYRQT